MSSYYLLIIFFFLFFEFFFLNCFFEVEQGIQKNTYPILSLGIFIKFVILKSCIWLYGAFLWNKLVLEQIYYISDELNGCS